MMPMIDSIKLSDVIAASRLDDQDKAIGSLQIIAGINGGDVAGQVFSGFDWRSSSEVDRSIKIVEWINAEKSYANAGRGPFTIEHYAALHFLFKALEDFKFSQHLPHSMENARRAMAALRKQFPLCDAWVRSQRRA